MQSEKAIGNGYHLQLMNGVLFVILFASAAYQLSQWHYISLLGISPLIVGIVLGMIYGCIFRSTGCPASCSLPKYCCASPLSSTVSASPFRISCSSVSTGWRSAPSC